MFKDSPEGQTQYEPAAPAGIDPVAWLNKKLPHMAVLTKPDDGGGWFPVVPAATVERLVQERDGLKAQVLRVVRGEFTQICSYCGWEAPPEGAQWEELQAHIKICPTHPAAQLAAMTQERDFNAAYFEAYHQLRVAVNAAYPQDPYQLAENVPALMQAELAAMTQERDMFEKVSDIRLNELAASQAREQQLREALEKVMRSENRWPDYVIDALALPQDDTALREWGAKLLREMAGAPHCKGNLFVRDELRRKADELMEGKE